MRFYEDVILMGTINWEEVRMTKLTKKGILKKGVWGMIHLAYPCTCGYVEKARIRARPIRLSRDGLLGVFLSFIICCLLPCDPESASHLGWFSVQL